MIGTSTPVQPSSWQVQASAMATTRADIERIKINQLSNAFDAFNSACRKAVDHYRHGRWYAGDLALMRAAHAVAVAAGEQTDFDLIGVKLR